MKTKSQSAWSLCPHKTTLNLSALICYDRRYSGIAGAVNADPASNGTCHRSYPRCPTASRTQCFDCDAPTIKVDFYGTSSTVRCASKNTLTEGEPAPAPIHTVVWIKPLKRRT